MNIDYLIAEKWSGFGRTNQTGSASPVVGCYKNSPDKQESSLGGNVHCHHLQIVKIIVFDEVSVRGAPVPHAPLLPTPLQ